MTLDAAQHRSGKGSGDENFPVASWLVAPPHRAPILAFYEFVRIADDIADHATLKPEDKLAFLDGLEQSLLGRNDNNAAGVKLRAALAGRNLSPVHAQELLRAFRQDVTKLRYDDWDDLIDYCRYSAMPVGRFVLDVHGESPSLWPANDALCAALQVINHLQDCGKDYRDLNRVYLPRDALTAAGAAVEELGGAKSSPQMLKCLHALAARTSALLDQGKALAPQVRDFRLSLEVSVIQAFADKIVAMLKVRDPLSERVHLSPLELMTYSLRGMAGEAARRAFGRSTQSKTANGA